MSAGSWPQAGYVSEPYKMCLSPYNPSLLHHNGNIHSFLILSSAHNFTLMLTVRSTASANASHKEHLASVSFYGFKFFSQPRCNARQVKPAIWMC